MDSVCPSKLPINGAYMELSGKDTLELVELKAMDF